MDRNISLDAADLNAILIILTASLVSLALVAVCFLFLKISCGCCNKQPTRRQSSIPQVMITQHRDKTPLSLDDPDMDYIDSSRNTNLISSTVQVESVHKTPTIS